MNSKIGKALVVGAGISGIRAALDLAETGYGVTLIDRAPHMGGILSQLDYQFPSNHCGMCKMLPVVNRDASSQYCLRKGLFHENIDILFSTELVSVEGEPGNFQLTLRQKSNWVDPALCIGCGKCEKVCPVEIPDAFNMGFNSRKAVYLPIPHAIPNPYIIDFSACTRCGECVTVCPTGAIRLSEKDREKFHILVVDDELIVRDSLKAWLGEEGFTVDVAESGPDALALLAEKPYHLMLTDIKMPGMDGVELLKKAKEDFPDVTVVMMTAYATVETAVEAMKTGALDYLVKPFDPDKLIPMTLRIFEEAEAAQGLHMEVGALVLCGGTDYYNPSHGKNLYGYKMYPNVVTSLEFERIFSGSGPSQGELVRPFDRKPIQKVAWIQCVGSRDLQTNADFCSNICCMYALKEAMIAKEKSNGQMEATIFYMDMRTFGKSFQRYRDQAESQGVDFVRGRVHSVDQDEKTGELIIRHTDQNGITQETRQDMVVLAVGQRPALGTNMLAEQTGIQTNPWGFLETEPFSLTRTSREGIVIGGSFGGLKDISESVTQASSAAFSASRVIHGAGGSLIPTTKPAKENAELLRQVPRVLAALCTCSDEFEQILDKVVISARLKENPVVDHVAFVEKTCTQSGWDAISTLVKEHRPNRVLLGACLPYVYKRQINELAAQTGLSPSLIEVVDIRTPAFSSGDRTRDEINRSIIGELEMGIARMKAADPFPVDSIQVQQRALVVGGGIAGITAAMGIADHGFQVDLVERSNQLGGNLLWLDHTLEGQKIKTYLEENLQRLEKHPLIQVHLNSQVLTSCGEVGNFLTTIETQEADSSSETRQAKPWSLDHGVTILATGGVEASTTSYGYGTGQAIVTQKELENIFQEDGDRSAGLKSVVMIQCVDSREEPRNYCSRICCASALKNALYLKEKDPSTSVYILYRDMMSYGFLETYYTQARQAGVIFIQYHVNQKPQVQPDGNQAAVTVFEPILGQEITIDADLVVLATGIVPTLPGTLAESFGTSVDRDGFFQEAESKWRPMDSIKEGVFGCGLSHSPRSVAEAVSTAEAAVQRSLRVLCRKQIPAGKQVAKVRYAICSLCERCIDVCPYGARTLDADQGKILINPVMCQGCGSCASVCPNGASIVEGFLKQQMFEIIDAAVA